MGTRMTLVEDKLRALGCQLPPPPVGSGNYLPFRRAGSLLFLAGAISARGDGSVIAGKAGAGRTQEEAHAAAKVCALNQLAVVKAALGSLDAVRRIMVVNGYVNAAPDFTEISAVIDGASDLLAALYGDAGQHARAAVGVASLPKGALVEVQMTIEAAEANGQATDAGQ